MILLDIAGACLDTLKGLGDTLLEMRRTLGPVPLVLFKSDVAEVYRLMPMHPYWQVKQINTIDGCWHSDRCNCFGGRGSYCIWYSFNGLVTLIAIKVKKIDPLNVFSDDSFSVGLAGRMLFYTPYAREFPKNQTWLLLLWDELGIPHKEKKQLFGPILTIIRLEVDANLLTITMPKDFKADLISRLREMARSHNKKGGCFSLREIQQLASWVNWALNAYPLLEPSLCHLYLKIAGKVFALKKMSINCFMLNDFEWLASHMERSSGVHILRSIEWNPMEADIVAFCDASPGRLGFWFPDTIKPTLAHNRSRSHSLKLLFVDQRREMLRLR